MEYKVEVIADASDGAWCTDGSRFESREEAEEFARAWEYHWSRQHGELPGEWRIVPAECG